jgi:hypothetical protein
MGTTLTHGVMRAIWTVAVAVPLLAGCGSADGEAEPSASSSESPTEDTAADLEASAPDGKYAAAYVLESSNVPGAKDGFESSSTYAFKLGECTDTECMGTVAAPVEGSYTWDGSDLVVTFDEITKQATCTGEDGQPMKGSTYRSSTEHGARVSAAAGVSDEAPKKLEGTYQQETVFSDLKNGCDPAGADHQQAKFSLVLERK